MKHRCSICGTTYDFDYEPGGKLPRHFPFCSPRCKTIDLGRWFNEEYRISTPLPNADMMDPDEKDALAQFLLDMGENEDE